MTMERMGGNHTRGVLASVLIAVFFSSQVFSCCIVNHRLGEFLRSAWSGRHTLAAAHACCPRAESAGAKHEAPTPASQPTGCCIQDANQKLPQAASEQVPLPNMTGLVVAMVPRPSPTQAPVFPVPPRLQSRSSPPAYLTHLSLLL